MFGILFKSWQTYLAVLLYGLILAWWFAIGNLYEAPDNHRYVFNFAYGFIALLGIVTAFRAAFTVWGGFRSTLGKMLIFIGLGLLLEWLGIVAWLYFNLSGTEAPYPSIADLGYFGLVPMYIIASLLLWHATGGRQNLRGNPVGKAIVALLPVVSLVVAFLLFVRKVGFEDSNVLKVFFDLAYPIGEIIPVTIATAVLVLATRRLSGGIMKGRVLFLIFAFFAQFLAEYVFLYQFGAETYINAGLADLLYATSYFIMTLAVISYSRIE